MSDQKRIARSTRTRPDTLTEHLHRRCFVVKWHNLWQQWNDDISIHQDTEAVKEWQKCVRDIVEAKAQIWNDTRQQAVKLNIDSANNWEGRWSVAEDRLQELEPKVKARVETALGLPFGTLTRAEFYEVVKETTQTNGQASFGTIRVTKVAEK